MILTREIFEQGKSSNNGWNGEQLRILGINQPLPSGWRRSITGKDFPEEVIKQFLSLKDYHFKKKLDDGGSVKAKIAAKLGRISFIPVHGTIPYKEQYLHPNWQKMRLMVFERDKYMCVNCKSAEKTLHAHHLKYLKGKFVWEVPMWYIVTLCENCHSEEHGRDLTLKK